MRQPDYKEISLTYNGKITNFTVSKDAADVTAALNEIGKNA